MCVNQNLPKVVLLCLLGKQQAAGTNSLGSMYKIQILEGKDYTFFCPLPTQMPADNAVRRFDRVISRCQIFKYRFSLIKGFSPLIILLLI